MATASTTASTTQSSGKTPHETLTSYLHRTPSWDWRAWYRYLVPDAEGRDPRFRRTVTRLSLIGLRIIAGFCLGGAVLWAVLGLLVLPASLTGFGTLVVITVFALGAAVLLLSFWPPVRDRARWLGLGVLAALPMLDLMGSMSVSITSGERWAFLVAMIILMMLVAIAALPVLPLQMAALGALCTGMYGFAVHESGANLLDGSAVSIAFVFLVIATLTCTGLVLVTYQQRLLAYRARRAAEQAFEQLQAAQVRVNVSENAASQSRFAAALSHELNTPLGSLTSAFDTIVHARERELREPDMRERLEPVWKDATRAGQESATRLKETITRMKRLTNLDRADVQLTDLNQLWRDTAALLSGTIERKASIELALQPLPPVRLRPQQMGAVFSNLLRNAAAAMSEPGRIRISSELRGEEIVLEVHDNGRGMPESQLRDLFQPKVHIDGARVATTNWGLFVCRSIVMEHGGVLEIESEEGVGTTARVVLPMSR